MPLPGTDRDETERPRPIFKTGALNRSATHPAYRMWPVLPKFLLTALEFPTPVHSSGPQAGLGLGTQDDSDHPKRLVLYEWFRGL